MALRELLELVKALLGSQMSWMLGFPRVPEENGVLKMEKGGFFWFGVTDDGAAGVSLTPILSD